MKVTNIKQLQHIELRSSASNEKYSLSAVLTQHSNFKDLFIHHEILHPGRRSSAQHFHSQKEEFIFVLKGSPVAHIGKTVHQLQEGDFIGFNPIEAEAHYCENLSTEQVQLLVICSNPPNDITNFVDENQ